MRQWRQTWKVGMLWAFLLVLVSGCGGDNISSTGSLPPAAQFPTQAPVPSLIPPGGYGYFTPQLPQGYTSQYYMFLPLYYYMSMSQARTNYWNQLWSGWQQYAAYYGYQTYNFNAFWYQYAQSQWASSYYSNLYRYFNQTFYSWMTPQTYLPSTVNASYFWQNYSYYPYQDVYGDCGCSYY